MESTAVNLIDAKAAAMQLDVSLPRLYELVRLGIVPVVRLGRSLRFDTTELRRFVDSGGAGFPGGWRKERIESDADDARLEQSANDGRS